MMDSKTPVDDDPEQQAGWYRRMPHWKRVIVLTLYILCPIDFAPELVFGVFGLVDDAAVLLALVFYEVPMALMEVLSNIRARRVA